MPTLAVYPPHVIAKRLGSFHSKAPRHLSAPFPLFFRSRQKKTIPKKLTTISHETWRSSVSVATRFFPTVGRQPVMKEKFVTGNMLTPLRYVCMGASMAHYLEDETKHTDWEIIIEKSRLHLLFFLPEWYLKCLSPLKLRFLIGF